MGQFTDGIRVSLRLVEPKYCMSLVLPGKVGSVATAVANTNFVWTG